MLIGEGVFCNICPLKSMCKYANHKACYNISRLVVYNDPKKIKDGDFQKQQESTKNCPLLRMVNINE